MKFLLTIRYRLEHCCSDVYIGYGVHIRPHCVSVGHKSFIGSGSWLASKMIIGNYVMFAGRVTAVGGDHRFDIPGVPIIESGRDINKPIIIEDDVWIGHGSILLHGIRIGEGAIVASGSVVTKDIPPYSIVAGVPAVVIRSRFDNLDQRLYHSKELQKRRGFFK